MNVFPSRLIPSEEKLAAFEYCESCYLFRRDIIFDQDDMFDEFGKLDPIVIPERDVLSILRDGSFNIHLCPDHNLSGETKIFDCKIEITSKVDLERWNHEDSHASKAKNVQFKIAKGFYFITIKDLFDSNKDSKTIEWTDGNNKEHKAFFKLMPAHDPLRANFYHIESHASLQDENKNEIKSEKPASKKNNFKHLLAVTYRQIAKNPLDHFVGDNQNDNNKNKA